MSGGLRSNLGSINDMGLRSQLGTLDEAYENQWREVRMPLWDQHMKKVSGQTGADGAANARLIAAAAPELLAALETLLSWAEAPTDFSNVVRHELRGVQDGKWSASDIGGAGRAILEARAAIAKANGA